MTKKSLLTSSFYRFERAEKIINKVNEFYIDVVGDLINAVISLYCLYALYWQSILNLFVSVDTADIVEKIRIFMIELPPMLVEVTRGFSVGEVAILAIDIYFGRRKK